MVVQQPDVTGFQNSIFFVVNFISFWQEGEKEIIYITCYVTA